MRQIERHEANRDTWGKSDLLPKKEGPSFFFIFGSFKNEGLKIIGLFFKRALWKRRYSAKETCNFKEPTNRSHPIPWESLQRVWSKTTPPPPGGVSFLLLGYFQTKNLEEEDPPWRTNPRIDQFWGCFGVETLSRETLSIDSLCLSLFQSNMRAFGERLSLQISRDSL